MTPEPATRGTVAALYVERGGCYYNLPDVDPWDEARDARTYAGPWHDGGCFAAALAAVREWGGVLEHPEASAAWQMFGLVAPPRRGGWVVADWVHGWRGWTCCVEQGAYGHAARKATWLYVHGLESPPLLSWKARGTFLRLDEGFHSADERRAAVKDGILQLQSKKLRARTPLPFRDLLIEIAESCTASHAFRTGEEVR